MRRNKLLVLFILLMSLPLTSGWSPDYAQIADLKNYPQNAYAYINKATAYKRLISAGDQAAMNAEFDTKYFFPWHHAGTTGYSLKDAEWAFQEFRAKEGFGETKQRRPASWFDELKAYAALENFPNRLKKAITTRGTNLRMLPTDKPFFYTFWLDGEGYPFDNIQHAWLQPNTPLFVSHLSRDGAWALVETHAGLGWIPVIDLAYVDDTTANTFEGGRYVAITRDNTAVSTDHGMYLFTAHIGAQFPLIDETSTHFVIAVAVSNEGRMAKLFKARIPRENGATRPLALTPYNLATVINNMMGKPYGWGGAYGNRDCSSLIKNLFSVFGIYLPTNSGDQIRSGRSSLELGRFSNAEKKRVIMARGVPFLTLVGMKGHAMLYIGNYRNQPMVFHSFWGVRTADNYNPDGRHLVAKAAITTLEAGWELPNHAPESQLINKVYKLAYITDLSK